MLLSQNILLLKLIVIELFYFLDKYFILLSRNL